MDDVHVKDGDGAVPKEHRSHVLDLWWRYQAGEGNVHPFTCGTPRCRSTVLEPIERDGKIILVCPNSCDWKQDVTSYTWMVTQQVLTVAELYRANEREMTIVAQKEEAYTDRNLLAQLCQELAHLLGFDVGWATDPNSPDYPVCLIDLPGVGQITYHIPEDERIKAKWPVMEWDGHTTAQKRDRIRSYVKHVREMS